MFGKTACRLRANRPIVIRSVHRTHRYSPQIRKQVCEGNRLVSRNTRFHRPLRFHNIKNTHVALTSFRCRVSPCVHHVGNRNRKQDADDQHHNHYFNQRKAAPFHTSSHTLVSDGSQARAAARTQLRHQNSRSTHFIAAPQQDCWVEPERVASIRLDRRTANRMVSAIFRKTGSHSVSAGSS